MGQIDARAAARAAKRPNTARADSGTGCTLTYGTHSRKPHSMDLRRIVAEVEERKRQEYALIAPPRAAPRPAGSSGVRASILETVRERMLREDPGADVSGFNAVIEPARATPPPEAPPTTLAAEPAVVTIAREAPRAAAKEAHAAPPRALKAREDFLARYLVMSE